MTQINKSEKDFADRIHELGILYRRAKYPPGRYTYAGTEPDIDFAEIEAVVHELLEGLEAHQYTKRVLIDKVTSLLDERQQLKTEVESLLGELATLRFEKQRIERTLFQRFVEDLIEDSEDWPPDDWTWPYFENN